MGIYGNPKENLHSKPLPPTRKSEKKPTIQRGLLLVVVVVGWLSTTHAEAPCGGKKHTIQRGLPARKSGKKHTIQQGLPARKSGKNIQFNRACRPESLKKHTIQRGLLFVACCWLLLVVVVDWLLSTNHAEAPSGGKTYLRTSVLIRPYTDQRPT